MTKELQELYDFLQINYLPLDEDLSINAPDKDENIDYICCDQKIITFVDEYYNICCLYDGHPCVRFKSKDEVIAFYNGYNEGYNYKFETPVDIAYSAGKIYSSAETLQAVKNLKMPVSPIQKIYNLQNSDEDKK